VSSVHVKVKEKEGNYRGKDLEKNKFSAENEDTVRIKG